jgi:hypothetical protein
LDDVQGASWFALIILVLAHGSFALNVDKSSARIWLAIFIPKLKTISSPFPAMLEPTSYETEKMEPTPYPDQQ